MNLIIYYLQRVITMGLTVLNESSVWLVASFVIAGVLHAFLRPESFQKSLGNTSLSSLSKATISGMLIPVCSCGVIPLGLGLYYSGAYLGPTLAFMSATPIINPAAVILAYGLLGPKIATIYLFTGFLVPFIIGGMGNSFGGTEVEPPVLGIQKVKLITAETPGFRERLLEGLRWGFRDLGVQVSKYIIWGMLTAAIIITLVPTGFFQHFLGSRGFASIAAIAALGAIMYVCAVGHIPLAAALVASGASPGVAITFLMAGAATNVPELISIYNMIGRRAMLIYGLGLIGLSLAAGYATNQILLPGFRPFIDLSRNQAAIGWARLLVFGLPASVSYLCSFIIGLMFLYAYYPGLKIWFNRSFNSGNSNK